MKFPKLRIFYPWNRLPQLYLAKPSECRVLNALLLILSPFLIWTSVLIFLQTKSTSGEHNFNSGIHGGFLSLLCCVLRNVCLFIYSFVLALCCPFSIDLIIFGCPFISSYLLEQGLLNSSGAPLVYDRVCVARSLFLYVVLFTVVCLFAFFPRLVSLLSTICV